MKVIIPLAGLGKRLRPHTHTRPKPLVHVAGKPLLGHLLDQLLPYGIEEYVFIVGYLGEQIIDYVNANYHIQSTFYDQKELNGQAGAVYLARQRVSNDGLIIFGDTLFDHHETGFDSLESIKEDGLLYVKEVDDPRRFGVVVTNHLGEVVQLIEKPKEPPSKLVNVGIYYVKEMDKLYNSIEMLMSEKKEGELYLLDALNVLVNNKMRFTTRPIQGWLDCGTKESLLETNRVLLSQKSLQTLVIAGELKLSQIIPPVSIDIGATIVNSVVGPYVSIGRNAEIIDSRIANSIINPYARVHKAVLEHTIVGERASVMLGSTQLDVGDDCQIGF